MWKGHEAALALYYNAMLLEWERRGGKNEVCTLEQVDTKRVTLPTWLGEVRLCVYINLTWNLSVCDVSPFPGFSVPMGIFRVH